MARTRLKADRIASSRDAGCSCSCPGTGAHRATLRITGVRGGQRGPFSPPGQRRRGFPPGGSVLRQAPRLSPPGAPPVSRHSPADRAAPGAPAPSRGRHPAPVRLGRGAASAAPAHWAGARRQDRSHFLPPCPSGSGVSGRRSGGTGANKV